MFPMTSLTSCKEAEPFFGCLSAIQSKDNFLPKGFTLNEFPTINFGIFFKSENDELNFEPIVRSKKNFSWIKLTDQDIQKHSIQARSARPDEIEKISYNIFIEQAYYNSIIPWKNITTLANERFFTHCLKPINEFEGNSFNISCIKADTSIDQFKKHLELNPEYVLDSNVEEGCSPICAASRKGNVPLIEYIISIGNVSFLRQTSTLLMGTSVLDCAIYCENSHNGYLAAKKLIQLGTPVNIVDVKLSKDGQKIWECTALERALITHSKMIAKMLIRMGGIARIANHYNNSDSFFNSTKQEIKKENEQLLLLQIMLNEKKLLPWDMYESIRGSMFQY